MTGIELKALVELAVTRRVVHLTLFVFGLGTVTLYLVINQYPLLALVAIVNRDPQALSRIPFEPVLKSHHLLLVFVLCCGIGLLTLLICLTLWHPLVFLRLQRSNLNQIKFALNLCLRKIFVVHQNLINCLIHLMRQNPLLLFVLKFAPILSVRLTVVVLFEISNHQNFYPLLIFVERRMIRHLLIHCLHQIYCLHLVKVCHLNLSMLLTLVVLVSLLLLLILVYSRILTCQTRYTTCRCSFCRSLSCKLT